jgi:chromosome segregation protein
MDKGTHYYQCDFQVHTPRDINWKGIRPINTEDRQAYASSFVNECRSKGINAVAITDHHDFCFFPYIRNAAHEELDENGNSISPENKLIVFPGLELTLSTPPCQALLIIDATYPETGLAQILHLLAITPAE